MSWQEFISSIVKSTAWPIIVLIAVLALRKPVETLILKIAQLRLKTFRYGELEATFEDILDEAEAKAEETKEANDQVSSNDNSERDIYSDIITVPYDLEEHLFTKTAEEAPYLGVFISWRELELELASTMKRLGDPITELSRDKLNKDKKIIHYLEENGYLNREHTLLFKKLRAMRNTAVHHPETVITYEEAARYRNLTKSLIRALKRISSPNKTEVLQS
ncbi:hypothetical protein MOC96_00200 [Bacillus vallismortis]|uniref:hypothetical protein n=1 Tax=Bacillus vallismortis TaxID=72361 RepID=UPI00227ECBB5|nr:hypothetical protein [Bacillus vallismortis]MCY8307175.1 hypothetical protein [Bacillus vallismortis]